MLALFAFAAILAFFFTGNVWALLFAAAFALLAFATDKDNQPRGEE